MMAIRRMLLQIGGSDLKLLGEYIVPESWETDDLGNGKAIWNDVVYPIVQNEPISSVIVATAENNTSTSNYAIVKMVGFAAQINNNDSTSCVLRKNNSIRNNASITSAYCAQGTIIKVYKVI